MSMTITANTGAIQRSLAASTMASDTAMQRLSSGHRINSAKDDAAGLAISTRMDSRLKGMAVAGRNAADGSSMAQTADASLGQTSEMMTRMRELATQAANGTNGTSDMANLDKEYQALASEVTRTLTSTDFNGKKILGADAGATNFIVGADATDSITVTTTDMTANANITAVTGGSLTTAAGAATAMTNLSKALDDVNTERAMYGATSSRFDTITSTLQTQADALTTAKGRITDTDYAAESANMQKNNVLSQAATAMLSQANARPQQVLSLLR
ncbi:MAG: flagellin [Agitococcus sp.]|nr:flagellin [Agitococcus sp.]